MPHDAVGLTTSLLFGLASGLGGPPDVTPSSIPTCTKATKLASVSPPTRENEGAVHTDVYDALPAQRNPADADNKKDLALPSPSALGETPAPRRVESLFCNITADIFQQPVMQFVQRLADAIPEAALMFGEVKGTTEGLGHSAVAWRSFSRSVGGRYNAEAERAWLGAACLYWAYRGASQDYEAFVAGQADGVKLRRETFDQIHAYVRATLRCDEDVRAALWSVLCNDLGKLKQIENLYEEWRTSADKRELDHDQVLGYLLTHKPGAFAAFSQLGAQQQQDIAAGFNSGCDVAHFAHLEIPATALEGLRRLPKRARDLYIVHSLFDVAGARAHVGGPGTLTMDEPTWRLYADVRDALGHLDDAEMTNADVFAHYARLRGHVIGLDDAFEQAPVLRVVAAMARLSTPSDADVLTGAWRALTDLQRQTLAFELGQYARNESNVDPIRISYGPTLMHNGIAYFASQKKDSAVKTQGMALGLKMLADMFGRAREAVTAAHIAGRLPSTRVAYIDARSVAAQLARAPNEILDYKIIFTPTSIGAIADAYPQQVTSPFQAVVFDCDGVLVDSEETKFVAWQQAFRQFGVDFTAEQYKEVVGFDNQHILKHVRGMTDAPSVPDSIIEKKEAVFEGLHARSMTPITANVDFLKRLAAAKTHLGLKLGLASSASRSQIESTMRALDIAQLFDVVISGQDDLAHINEQKRNKPAPYIYQEIARMLGIAVPTNVLVFEDSSAGVTAAHMAGMITCALPNTWTVHQNFSEASGTKTSLFGEDVMSVLQDMRQVGVAPKSL